ncbi:MAG: metallophosphoesterase family protein [Candidatus Eremiobacteraeota bacterium]|nr:metallophosphoesterase family protein [Candidatus Eremiobacteraeota bacterium]MBV8366017.1 metallophosphoesterase family protein [Candidatus Eremiobacteraeota bacterium]
MRYAIVSDIHSNLEALQAVMAEIDAMGADRLLCLGDIVGYGPSPNECCDLLRERAVTAIAGNHDAAAVRAAEAERFNPLARAAIAWTRTQLTPENLDFLAGLPRERRIDGLSLVHGAPVHHFEYIMDVSDAQRAFERTGDALTLVGHSHVAEVYYQDPGGRTFQQRLLHGGRIDIVPEFRYIINVGSVGQPRDRNPQASFAVYDSEASAVHVLRVAYDIDRVRERMARAELPEPLSERLAAGW